MSLDLQTIQSGGIEPRRLPAIRWRDPHSVPPETLRGYIAELEQACAANPESADLRTCLGMAHAMNYDVYKSMDALEDAIRADNRHFFARLKYGELLYRIRALPWAERETVQALDLADNAWELALARKQLQTIREQWRHGTQKPEWTGSLTRPTLALLALFLISSLVVLWSH